MAESIKSIRSSGGDYTTLSGWESGEQADLTATGTIAIAECYDDWAAGLDDTCTVAGWTTDSGDYIIIRAADGHGHDGTPDTGFWVQKSQNFAALLQVDQDYTQITQLEVHNNGGSSAVAFSSTSGTAIVWDRCIASDGSGGFSGIQQGQTVRNSLAVGCTTGFASQNWEVANFYNCVAAGNTTGFNGTANGAGPIVKNCVSYGNSTNYAANIFNSSCSNNASSDYTGDAPPGSSAYTSDVVSGDFVNAASNDYHITTGSGLYQQGADLSGTFTTDMDGETWGGTWSIGFDEPSAGGGVTMPIFMSNLLRQMGS